MDNVIIAELARENDDMSDVDRLVNVYWAVSQNLVHNVPGDVVELGCNAGRTSVFLQMIIDAFAPGRRLHVYDSFAGLPAPGGADAYLKEGDCHASVEELTATFRRWNVRPPTVHAGWFTDTLPTELPEQVCFAYLDSDFYDSIQISLSHVWPRMAPHGLILIDDYAAPERNPAAWDGLPGVRKAVDEFFADDPDDPFVLYGTGDLAMAGVRKSPRPSPER